MTLNAAASGRYDEYTFTYSHNPLIKTKQNNTFGALGMLAVHTKCAQIGGSASSAVLCGVCVRFGLVWRAAKYMYSPMLYLYA